MNHFRGWNPSKLVDFPRTSHCPESEHQWLFTEYSGLEARMPLASIPVELALTDLYEGVINA